MKTLSRRTAVVLVVAISVGVAIKNVVAQINCTTDCKKINAYHWVGIDGTRICNGFWPAICFDSYAVYVNNGDPQSYCAQAQGSSSTDIK